jgi:hypothetical protein
MGEIIQFIPPEVKKLPVPNEHVFAMLARLVVDYNEPEKYFLDFEAAKDVFTLLQSQNRELITALEELENGGVISNSDKVILGSLFLTAKEIGPDMSAVESFFVANVSDINSVRTILNNLNIDQAIKEFLSAAIDKVISSQPRATDIQFK